jgi:hypothetical protein
MTVWASSSVRSLGPSSRVTEMYAILPSLLSAALPALEFGLTATVTCGAFFTDLTVCLTALALSPLSSLPLLDSSTIGLVP